MWRSSFLSAEEEQELIQAFGEGPIHAASQQGGKSSFLKQVMQLFDLKAIRGGRKEVIYLSHSIFFFPKHADGEAL